MTATADERAVETVVQRYVDGARQADSTVVGSAFHPDARMWGFLGEQYLAEPIGAFLEVVSSSPAPGDSYRPRIEAVRVDGDVAAAILVESDYLGKDFVNYFALTRGPEGWLIAAKVFTTNATNGGS